MVEYEEDVEIAYAEYLGGKSFETTLIKLIYLGLKIMMYCWYNDD